jgi:hypothetical protein
MTPDFLDAIEIAASRIPGPLQLPWPMPGNPEGFVNFEIFRAWKTEVLNLGLYQTALWSFRARLRLDRLCVSRPAFSELAGLLVVNG